MTLFDSCAGLVLVVSGLFGFLRGATREITTALAFILAAVVAAFALPVTAPIAGQAIHTRLMADTAAFLVAFILAYIAFRLVGGLLTQGVRRIGLSGPDRALGLGVGVVRGLVLLGAFILLIDAATPPERIPAWITGARLYPLANASGNALRAFAPRGIRVAQNVAPGMVAAVSGEEPLFPAPRHRSLNVVVEKSR